jgi:hypothetical protein
MSDKSYIKPIMSFTRLFGGAASTGVGARDAPASGVGLCRPVGDHHLATIMSLLSSTHTF